MDNTKHPAINIEKIHLIECSASVSDPSAELRYNLALTQLLREEKGGSLFVLAGFDLMHGVDKPPCSLTCSFAAEYTQTDPPNMTWKEFSDGLVVAHILPYVREFVSSVTLRMPMSVLILSPSNTFVLVDEYNKRKALEATPPAKG